MKVALINSVYDVGSTGKIVSGLKKIIELNGLEATVIYGRGKRKSNTKSIYFVSFFLEKLFHVIMTRIFDSHGLHSFFATRKVCKILDIEKPDIIHLHNIHGYYIDYFYFFNYLKNRNIPVIWTLHDCWPFTGHCAYFDKVKCLKWQSECNNCPQLNSYPKSIFFDRTKINFNYKKKIFNGVSNLYLVGVSDWISRHIKDSFLSNKFERVIYNGVDTNIFTPKTNTTLIEKYKLENKFILLSVAKIWESRKGLEDLIKLINDLPDYFVLIIVGRVLGNSRASTNRLIFINNLDDQNMLADFYSISNIFLNLSTEDNLPMTIIEALACGTPVFTYDTGGCAEVISNRFGKVFSKGDLKGLSFFIKQNQNNYKSKLNLEIINEIKEKFSQNIQYQKYVDLYLNKTYNNIKH